MTPWTPPAPQKPKREMDPGLAVLLVVIFIWLASLPAAAVTPVMPPAWIRWTILIGGTVGLVVSGLYFLGR